MCKPSYRLFSNICVKMYDGCLESRADGFCSKCLDGAYLYSYGICDLKYLSCLQVSSSGVCVACVTGYSLQTLSNKCINADPNCKSR